MELTAFHQFDTLMEERKGFVMATPGQLVSKLSEVLNIAEATMSVYDRALRDAGLLSKGGRGRSSVHRTPLDTARLLIALLVTTSPARAPEAVKDFGVLEFNTTILRNPDSLTIFKLCGPELSEKHSLEDAFSKIIEGFGKQKFFDLMHEYASHSELEFGESFLPNISVNIVDTFVRGEINIDGNIHLYEHPSQMRLTDYYRKNKERKEPNFSDEEYECLLTNSGKILAKYGGIKTERTLLLPQIAKIAQFVCGVEWED